MLNTPQRHVTTRAMRDDDATPDSTTSSSSVDENDAMSEKKPDEKPKPPPRPLKTISQGRMKGMGTRYVDVPIEDISVSALIIASVLAIASAVAVGYLVFTASSKDSPQFQRRDGLDSVKLGFVEVVDDRTDVA